MTEFLMSLLPWGAQAVASVQGALYDLCPWLWIAITRLGNEVAYIVFIALIFWCIDRKTGTKVALAFTISALLNTILKSVFTIPRPFVYDSTLTPGLYYSGYSFPSGHAQLASAVWLTFALSVRKRWVTWVTLAFTLLIGLSRVVLAVHYPQDVLIGLLLGWVVALWVVHMRLDVAPTGKTRLVWPIVLLIVGLVSAIVLGESAAIIAAGLGGLWAGYLMQPALVISGENSELGPRLLRGLIALTLLGLVWLLHLALITWTTGTLQEILLALTYALMGFALTGLLGRVYLRLGLAALGKDSGTVSV